MNLPNENPVFEKDDLDMSLTTAGLMPEKTEEFAKIYSEEDDLRKTKERWHETRTSKRGSRNSSQKIFGVIASRLTEKNENLPSVPELVQLLNSCDSRKQKSQIIYLYILESDILVRYVVSEVLSQTKDGEDFDFSTENISSILDEIKYLDGKELEYSNSTLEKWISNLRSLMREIDVIKSKRSTEGDSPGLKDNVIEVSALYSHRKQGNYWIEQPIGWMYLFQPPMFWEDMLNKLAEKDNWRLSEVSGRRKLNPNDEILK